MDLAKCSACFKVGMACPCSQAGSFGNRLETESASNPARSRAQVNISGFISASIVTSKTLQTLGNLSFQLPDFRLNFFQRPWRHIFVEMTGKGDFIAHHSYLSVSIILHFLVDPS